MTALAVAIIVKVGMMTSSPFPMPSASRARWMAAVPLEQETPYFTPQNWLNRSSNSFMYLPAEDIQFVFTQSVTYLSSLPARVGSQTGIISHQDISFLLFPYKGLA